MAGFEVIVRPVILPDIRPQAPRILAPEADPAGNIVVLSGGSGRLIDLTESESGSRSESKAVEKKRKFAKERIYKKDDDGTVDKDTYVDVERLKSVTMQDDAVTSYADPPKRDNVEILEDNQVRAAK